MVAVLVPVFVLVVVVTAELMATTRQARRERAQADAARNADTSILRYLVPDDQDPVAVRLRLAEMGYDVTADLSGGRIDAVVFTAAGPAGVDREEVRAAIARITLENRERSRPHDPLAVRFMDE